jgi:hypothetical protein
MRPSANSSAMTGAFMQPDRLGADWPFPFHVIRLWETPAETFLTGPLGMLPFAPIARVDLNAAAHVKLVIKDRLQHEATRSQRDILAAALVQLLALRYDDESINFWRDMMATLDISKTHLAEMFREEGRLEEKRADVLRMGRKKFAAPAPPEAKAAIEAITDLDRLNELIDRALDVSSWQDLLSN